MSKGSSYLTTRASRQSIAAMIAVLTSRILGRAFGSTATGARRASSSRTRIEPLLKSSPPIVHRQTRPEPPLHRMGYSPLKIGRMRHMCSSCVPAYRLKLPHVNTASDGMRKRTGSVCLSMVGRYTAPCSVSGRNTSSREDRLSWWLSAMAQQQQSPRTTSAQSRLRGQEVKASPSSAPLCSSSTSHRLSSTLAPDVQLYGLIRMQQESALGAVYTSA